MPGWLGHIYIGTCNLAGTGAILKKVARSGLAGHFFMDNGFLDGAMGNCQNAKLLILTWLSHVLLRHQQDWTRQLK